MLTFGKHEEEWKPIMDYPGYEISNHGNVKSLSRQVWNGKVFFTVKEKILKKLISSGGYNVINLFKDGKMIQKRISILVYAHFNGPIIKGLVIDHDNNNRLDYYYENLKQISQRENSTKDRHRYPKTSKYVGVYLHKTKVKMGHKKPWVARIHIGGKCISLGNFETEELAHEAYQEKLKSIKVC